MKNFISLILFTLTSFVVQAQHKQFERVHELGFGVGALNYTGDLSEKLRLRNSTPGGNVFYRHNSRNEVSAIKLGLLLGQLGVDEARSLEPRRALRAYDFSGLLLELSLVYEYNFFDYRDIKGRYTFSPYLFGGFAGNSFFDGAATPTFMSIPFGVGAKFKLKEGWNWGVEAGARKNFTDVIDGHQDEELLGSSTLTDWHYFAGFNLSYTFYNLVCKQKLTK